MQIQFANPVVLLALAPLLVHVLWMARRLHHFSRARRVTAISIRLLIILLLVASLAGMRIIRESKDLTVFFVIDAADSLPEKQREYARTFVQKALAEMGPNDRAGTILFGSGAALHQAPAFKPEYDQAQTVIDPSRSNIADAVQLAMVCFLGDVQKRIVLLSDGNQNVGNAEQAARSAAAAGIVIDVVPLEYENRNDVILEKVVVENRVSLEEPFDLTIFVSAREATVATLTVLQDGNVIGHTEVELEADRKNVFVYPTEVRDAGFTQFEVQLDVENDLIPENNRGFAFTYGEGEPRVLLVDGDAEPSQALPAMLVSEKINVDVVDPSGLPHTLRELQNYDALIFNNVAAGDVTIVQMRTIERAVHDLGLGFIMIGGENSFGAGGYNDSPIERILPVDMELKNEKIVPQGALVIVNHALEIPQGAYWAEQVTFAALDVLSPRDLMGVLYYSWQSQESWLFPVQEVGTKTRLRSLIQTMQTGDMPSFDLTLQMAYTALTNSTAAVRHIVIISDGDPATPNPTLIANIQQAKITNSTIVINPHNQRGRD
ncbi:VWA domain-containing protein, partial [Candidatus Sumerlaeota bacterium]|nr:VWA domain-containing protein [Candidatus Sumerlaeota bacterium]